MLSFSAFAQPARSAASDCHRIESAMERLACYDTVSGRSTAPAQPAPTMQSGPAADAATAADAGTATATAGAPLAGREPAARAASSSMIDRAWGFDPDSPRYDLSLYGQNYFLVARYTDSVNRGPFVGVLDALNKPQTIDSTEAEFQLSFKGRLWTTDDRRFGVWAAYTQKSQWQIYNADNSRPFRDTNYMPELFVSYRTDVELPGGFRWGLLNAGYTHQSNGRADVLSRSWDRLFVEVGVERKDLLLTARLWHRMSEDAKDDDNPDITDYLGHGAINALYRWRGNSFSGGVRGNVNTGKGAVQLGWTTPPFLGPLRGYVKVFSGYGESLIDYNWRQTSVGFGVALNDTLGR
jgi:phospholipase A1